MPSNVEDRNFNANVCMVYEPAISGYKGLDWSKLNQLDEKINSVLSHLNGPAYYSDFSGYISPISGSTLVFENSGYNTIGFDISNVTSGQIQFEGSFNGVDFTPITFRQIGNDGYTQFFSGNSMEDYIGSVSSIKKIRFEVISAGYSSGYIAGRLSRTNSVLEGIEHVSPPHKFGNSLFEICLKYFLPQ